LYPVGLAINFSAVLQGNDLGGVFEVTEAHAVVADTKTKLRRVDALESLHVTFAGKDYPAKE
jgi:hypothetical protein